MERVNQRSQIVSCVVFAASLSLFFASILLSIDSYAAGNELSSAPSPTSGVKTLACEAALATTHQEFETAREEHERLFTLAAQKYIEIGEAAAIVLDALKYRLVTELSGEDRLAMVDYQKEILRNGVDGFTEGSKLDESIAGVTNRIRDIARKFNSKVFREGGFSESFGLKFPESSTPRIYDEMHSGNLRIGFIVDGVPIDEGYQMTIGHYVNISELSPDPKSLEYSPIVNGASIRLLDHNIEEFGRIDFSEGDTRVIRRLWMLRRRMRTLAGKLIGCDSGKYSNLWKVIGSRFDHDLENYRVGESVERIPGALGQSGPSNLSIHGSDINPKTGEGYFSDEGDRVGNDGDAKIVVDGS